VFGGLKGPLVAAAVAAAFLAAPSAALACGSGVSAVDVYSECQQSGGGGKPTGSSTGTQNGTSVTPYVSKQTAKALKEAGADGKTLSNLVRGYGSARFLQLHASSAGEPNTVGSAFDLGSGPTLLIIVLAGTGVLLLGATGFRSVQQRRR
jgi:hypothetical protein